MHTEILQRLLFPRCCPICGRKTTGLLCPDCLIKESKWQMTRYRLAVGDYSLNHLSGAAALYRYQYEAAHAVRRMKYSGDSWRAAGFGHLMAARIFGCNYRAGYGILIPCEAMPMGVEFSGIVPVPATRPGVHIPGLLAKSLGGSLQLPVWDALYKSRPTPRQEGLNREQRKRNLWGSFGVRFGQSVEGKNILLVDDVVTTGTTLSACAYTLLQAGATGVFGTAAAAAVSVYEDAELPAAQFAERRDI